MSDENVIDKETARAEYDRWCLAWKIGKKRKFLKGESLEQVEVQEEMIIDLIMKGNLSLGDKNILHYNLEDPTRAVTELDMPRPKGSLIMAGDRFTENQSGHRAIALVAEVTGYAEKVISQFEFNTDISNLMAVIGHFLTA